MTRYHGQHGFGVATRALHWLVAILFVLAALRSSAPLPTAPLPTATGAQATMPAGALHIGLGLAAFALVLIWLLIRLVSPAPGPLHPERRLGLFLDRFILLTLWGGMALLPLSGWLSLATAPDPAPMPWPVGQRLPGLPVDAHLSETLRTLHLLAYGVVAGAVALHVLSALKHALIDRDATLARIATGAGPYAPPARFPLVALALALTLWAGVIAAAISLTRAAPPMPAPQVTAPAAPAPQPAAPTPPPTETAPETIDMPPPPAD